MTLSQFITKHTNKSASYDNVAADKGQCVQLVCVYWEEVYGFKCPMIPGAKDLWDNPTVLASFDQIAIGQEQAGDVAVWGASVQIDSPEYGHTDIVISPNSSGFLGFDSNWGADNVDGYPVAHQVQHNYTDVLGFLRWKGENMSWHLCNQGDVVNMFNALLNRSPQAAELKRFVGMDLGEAYNTVLHSSERNNLKLVPKDTLTTNPTVLAAGVYEVK